MKDTIEQAKETIKEFSTEAINDLNNNIDVLIPWNEDSVFSKGIEMILNRNNEMWEFPNFYEVRDFPSIKLLKELNSPFGTVSFRTPGIRKYNDCLDKKGLSVWDSKGYWRCLFPNSQIPNEILRNKPQDKILTKDDFELEIKKTGEIGKDGKFDFGAKGIFFKTFEDVMNWNSIMYKNMQQEKEKIRQERLKAREQRKREKCERLEQWRARHNDWKSKHKEWEDKYVGSWGFSNGDNNTSTGTNTSIGTNTNNVTNTNAGTGTNDNDKGKTSVDIKYSDDQDKFWGWSRTYKSNNSENPVSLADNDKKIISTDTTKSYKYEDDKAIYKEVRTEYYNDGTSMTHTITKTKPDNWEGNNTVDGGEDKKGWFWK